MAGDTSRLKASTTRPGQVLLAVAQPHQQTSLGSGPATTQVPETWAEMAPGTPGEARTQQHRPGPVGAAPVSAQPPVVKTRLIDAGLGKGRTAAAAAAAVVKATVVVGAVVEVEAAVVVAGKEEGAGGEGVRATPTTFRRTRSRTSR